MAQSFHDFLSTKDTQLQEAFNSAPYELSLGKKNAGDVYFTFVDEEEKEFRIQFYTPQGLGKNVRQVFIGQKRGSTYPDAISRFKNPMRVIASMIEATKQFLATPLGKTIDGFAINFSKKALERGVSLLPKIIRMSGLKQKLNVMDLTYTPIPDRAFVWVVRKGFDPAKVFDGPKMQGITWDDPDKVGDVTDGTSTSSVADTQSTTNVEMLPTNGNLETLNDQGYIERILNYVDGFVSTKGIYHGEKLASAGVGRYRTSGGLIIQLYFWGIVGGKLSVDVISELSKETLKVSGDTRNASKEITEAIFRAVDKQYDGEINVIGNPSGDVAYPVIKVSRSQGYTYIDCSSFIIKISDALIERYKIGDAIKLSLFKKLPQTSFPIQFEPRHKSSVTIIMGGNPLADIIFDVPKDNISPIQAKMFDTTKLKLASGDKLVDHGNEGFTIIWSGVKFPKETKFFGVVLASTYAFDSEKGNVEVIHTANMKGKVINKPIPYMLKPEYVKSSVDERSQRYQTVASQLSMLDSPDYNPKQLLLDQLEIDKNGEVLFMGTNIGLPSSRNFLLDAVLRATKKAEAGSSNGDKLATYADSIRDNAPKGRDLDWQIYASRDGKTLNVDWDITFRRNTTEGAFREFKAQIDRANQYLQTLYQDAKSKGYNPTEPNLMTLARAQQSDEFAQSNGESAYSEYEQSLGGNLQIRV